MNINPWFLITLIGEPEFWLILAVVLCIFYVVFRKHLKKKKMFKSFLIVFIVSAIIGFFLVHSLKDLTQVPRPCDLTNPYCSDSFSFPSGHSAAAFIFFTALLLYRNKKWLPILIVPILIAYSRVALGVHTFVDIIAGSFLGIVLTLLIWYVFKRMKII